MIGFAKGKTERAVVIDMMVHLDTMHERITCAGCGERRGSEIGFWEKDAATWIGYALCKACSNSGNASDSTIAEIERRAGSNEAVWLMPTGDDDEDP